MKTYAWIFFFILISSAAHAQQVEWIFGLNVSDFDYKEKLELPLKSTEKATVVAPFGRAKLFRPSLGRSYFQFEGQITGEVASHYDGSTVGTSGAVKPVQDTNYLAFMNLEADFYWDFMGSSSSALTPYFYAGLGYRYWDRFLSGGVGFREIYTWAYIPVGILVEVPLSSQWKGGLDLSVRSAFGGKIEVIFSETVTNGQDTTLNLGAKPGYKLQSFLQFAPNSNLQFSLSPWYEFSEIGESEFEYNSTWGAFIQEPASRTIQYGVAFGLHFFH